MIKIRQINVSILSLRSTFSKCSRQISTNNLTKPKVELEETPSSPLTDTFGRFHNYLRISLSERCNLRCQYCMPEEGIELTKSSKLLSTEEVIYLTQIFAKHGVQKVRLTGGEPLLRKDIAEICERISAIDGIKSIGLTTNGITGKRHFQKLSDAGLTHVNISLDTLIPEKFEFVSRRRGHHKVMESIDRALDLPFHSVKVNCVVMKGLNEDEIVPFVDFTKDKKVDIRFIEYMPFDGNKWNIQKFYPYQEMLKDISQKYPTLYKIEDDKNDTSKAYKVPNFEGQIGFITSMSQNFCGTCNRLRITADGNLKACLFGPNEISLRDMMRSGASEEELTQIISGAVKKKKKQHAVKIRKESGIYLGSTLLSPQLNKRRELDYKLNALLFGRSNLSVAQLRSYCTQNSKLTHVGDDGKLKMVDVGSKTVTKRTAIASGVVQLNTEIIQLIKENSIKKGDVITVAKVAGIMAAKRTDQMIPLCHNIALSSVNIDIDVEGDCGLRIRAVTIAGDKTGVEMEALTAVSVAALTVYDMCKALSHDIVIKDIRLEQKTGGKSDYVRK